MSDRRWSSLTSELQIIKYITKFVRIYNKKETFVGRNEKGGKYAK